MVSAKRIEFIDLAKGICILLVVLLHIGIDVNFLGMVSMRMPLYFVLSGLFFKDYGGLREFVEKKVNRLLLPFVFFYLLGYVIYYCVNILFPDIDIYGEFRVWSIFSFVDQRVYFNGPIWFLLALFWTNLLFGIITINVRSEYIRALIVLLIGVLGYIVGVYKVRLPFVFDVSMSALPFFYFGYLLRKSSILYPNRYDKYNLLFAIVFYLLSAGIDYIFDCPHIWFHFNSYSGNPLLAVLVSVTSVCAVLFLCKAIGYLPFISYIGRYSIVFLCTHHLVYRHLFLLFDETKMTDKYIVSCLTILICLMLVPICKIYIPWFVAQKDLVSFRQR
jgi:fucose 4-O-acetylase-like acetyltransferase